MARSQVPASKASVIGCGIIGLTSAIALQEAGFATRIITRDLPEATTSRVAAALWYPYKAYPVDRVLPWSAATLDALYDLQREPEAGVRIASVLELFVDPRPDPWWRSAVRAFRHARPEELPPGYADGFVIEVPIIESPLHLRYLMNRYRDQGGDVEVVDGGIASFDAIARPGHLVVNCTGLGARSIAGDASIRPIRGQVVRVRNPGLQSGLIEEHGPLAMCYIIPRTDDVIIGGTAQEGDASTEPDAETAARLLRNAAVLEPRLKDAEVLEHLVGLRPGRPSVRLELEARSNGAWIIHNYGHGGSGYTLNWGCAREVVQLAYEALGTAA